SRLFLCANAGCLALRRAMRTSLCASTASAGLAPACATDLSIAPIYQTPVGALPTWAGAYIGVAGGGALGSAAVVNQATGADQTPHFDLGGGLFGVTAGINAQGGNGVLGLEADISATSTSEFPPNAAFSNEVREQWLSTFRGRVGYARENWLVYATGGAALALANVANSIVAPADGAGPRAGASRSSSIRIGRRRSSTSTSDCRTNPISTQRRVRSFRAISVCTSTITSSASGSTTSCRGTCWTVSSSAE